MSMGFVMNVVHYELISYDCLIIINLFKYKSSKWRSAEDCSIVGRCEEREPAQVCASLHGQTITDRPPNQTYWTMLQAA